MLEKEANKQVASLIANDDVNWLLHRIKFLWLWTAKNPSNRPTHSRIWQGSYDVWENEQDRIDANSIPKHRMLEAEKHGLIRSEVLFFPGKTYTDTVWHLTELGEQVRFARHGEQKLPWG